jgi:hypothetical protein
MCEVIAGTVVTLSPQSNFASSALLDLGLAVELFERTAKQSHRAKLALVGPISRNAHRMCSL